MKKAILITTFEGEEKRIDGYVCGNDRSKFYLTRYPNKAYLGVKVTDRIELI